MAKGTPNAVRYRYPLPIHPIDSLPPLIPHNPVSWLYWTFCYFSSVNSLRERIHVEIIGNKYSHIIVKDADQMLYLWNNGFFGTGQMSRSEPTWRERTMTRLGVYDEENVENVPQMALEKVTERRRLLRLEFKKKRVDLEKQLLELRKRGGTIEEENSLLEKEREILRNFKAQQFLTSIGNEEVQIRPEDDELIDQDGKVVQLEYLELMPVEAIFLSFALPVLDISPDELLDHLIGHREQVLYKDIDQIVKQYVAYHHYRSHGWCVRSGIKFGCDYLLYKRGPPFQHAQFCVTILDSEEHHEYPWYSSVARVVGGAKKTLVLCYIQKMVSEDEILQMWKRNQLAKVFQSYKIGEVIYRRWVAGKNRD